MTSWRYRRCPACRLVMPASRLETLDLGARWGFQQPARRRCPSCGHTGTTSQFTVVREVHTAVDNRADS